MLKHARGSALLSHYRFLSDSSSYQRCVDTNGLQPVAQISDSAGWLDKAESESRPRALWPQNKRAGLRTVSPSLRSSGQRSLFHVFRIEYADSNQTVGPQRRVVGRYSARVHDRKIVASALFKYQLWTLGKRASAQREQVARAKDARAGRRFDALAIHKRLDAIIT